MKAFKVINVIDGAYLSAGYWNLVAFESTKKYITEYKLNEKTLPVPGTKLFCFSDLESAQYYIRDVGDTAKIFECEIENPSAINYVAKFWTKSISIEETWKSNPVGKSAEIPEGTIVVDSVTLLREILF